MCIRDRDEVHEDLNPSFRFDLEGAEITSSFDGWNFDGDNKSSEPVKDVDLDGIIRRKGGLIQMAGAENSDKSDSESEDEDELAMDGFGMGAKEEDSKDDESQEDSSSDEDEEEEEDKENASKELKLASEGKAGGDESELDDSDDAKAEFYAPEEESTEARKAIHTNFNSLSLSRPVLKGLGALNYVKPSPIQSATIPIALTGKDIIAGAVTGSGKTAACLLYTSRCV